jgi:hypothetical protein
MRDVQDRFEKLNQRWRSMRRDDWLFALFRAWLAFLVIVIAVVLRST